GLVGSCNLPITPSCELRVSLGGQQGTWVLRAVHPRVLALASLQAEEVQQQIIRETFHLVLKRDDHICNFLECGSLFGGSDYKLIYRHYATLYFVFCVDSSESELGILDLIQVSLSARGLTAQGWLAGAFPQSMVRPRDLSGALCVCDISASAFLEVMGAVQGAAMGRGSCVCRSQYTALLPGNSRGSQSGLISLKKIESQNHLGWKRPLRSLSPTVNHRVIEWQVGRGLKDQLVQPCR
uniref:Uncharacterized LOC113483955 n=1 Tax=Athene cunicularia TaxID=194338 RepID=A0A663MSI0_ATHCN